MVKKFVLGLNGLLLLGSIGVFAAQNIINQLNPIASNFGKNALNSALSINEQNASLNAWNAAFNSAKTFILNNSKNLVGVRDSDIVTALNALDKANNDIINVIKVTRGLNTGDQLKNQQTQLSNIQRTLVAATNKLSAANMTLNNKKEAKAVILSIGRFLEQIIQHFNTVIQQKIVGVKPALPPRGTSTQPTPPTRPAPATPTTRPEKMMYECSICLEERETVLIPCPNGQKHSQRICQECLQGIKRTTNKCPICREPLK